MKPRELLATAQIPGGDELRLYKRDTDFIIALGPNELMSSRLSGSEEALALLCAADEPVDFLVASALDGNPA